MVEDDLGYIWFLHILSKNYGCFLKNSKNITLVDVVRSLRIVISIVVVVVFFFISI